MSNLAAVVLGANYYVGLSVSRCLGKAGIKVTAARIAGHERVQYGLMSRFINDIIDLPDLVRCPEEAVPVLTNYASQQSSKPVLIPTADVYLLFIDKFREKLSQYYLLPPVPPGLCTRLADKDTLKDLALQQKIRIPKTLLAVELDEELQIVNDAVGYPCLIKPINSHKFTRIFGAKLLKADNRYELRSALARAKAKDIDVFIQQYISGPDDAMHTYDCYIDKEGRVVQYATCQKLRQFPINFGASTYIRPKLIPELHQIGSSFFKSIGYRGFAEIEFKRDSKTGEFFLIEVNPRITNFNQMLAEVGFNVPLLMVHDLNNIDLGPCVTDYKRNIHFWAGYEDFAAIRAYTKARQLTPFQILKSLLNKKVNAVWRVSDPKPFFRFVAEKANGILKKRYYKKANPEKLAGSKI